MARKAYKIAVNSVEAETIVTRSRFICYLAPCQSSEQAKEYIKNIQQLHPQATHHCYAFLAGAPDDSQLYGFSDDGEPTGTAGKPMLAVLQGHNVGEVCAVVVRYFGGTKLGTGGLQRAYAASVRHGLTFLKSKIKIPMVHKSLACQYNQVNDVTHVLEQLGAKIIKSDFSEQVLMTLAIPEAQCEHLQQQLFTLSAGELTLQKPDN
jgi:uncharacterized YigZ family protein